MPYNSGFEMIFPGEKMVFVHVTADFEQSHDA